MNKAGQSIFMETISRPTNHAMELASDLLHCSGLKINNVFVLVLVDDEKGVTLFTRPKV
jgi:hypothetical protein